MTRPKTYKKRVPHPPGNNSLLSVVTIEEAAKLWGVSTHTLRYHIDKGNLAARQSGRLWLISVSSLVAYYQYSPAIDFSLI